MDTEAATSFDACYGSHEVAPVNGRARPTKAIAPASCGVAAGPSPGSIRSAHRAYQGPDFIGLRVARTL